MGFERKNRKVSQLVSPLRFLITESFKLTGYSFPGLKGTQDFSMMKIGLSHNGSLEKRIFPPDIPPRRITQDKSYMRPVIGSTYTASLSERKAVDCQADEFSLELVCRYLVAEPEHGTYCFAVFVCKTD